MEGSEEQEVHLGARDIIVIAKGGSPASHERAEAMHRVEVLVANEVDSLGEADQGRGLRRLERMVAKPQVEAELGDGEDPSAEVQRGYIEVDLILLDGLSPEEVDCSREKAAAARAASRPDGPAFFAASARSP